jgi:hypothetical protein
LKIPRKEGLVARDKMIQPLSKEDETDAEVTWDDQNNINTFSKLHNKLADLQDLLAEKNVPFTSPSRPLFVAFPQGHLVTGRLAYGRLIWSR